MCITFFYIPKNTSEKFILAFNRDESMTKKTSILNSYEEDPNIIGGRDLEGRGTWCGMNKSTGVIAFLTNYDTQNFHDISELKYGRGNLTFRFLKSEFGHNSEENLDKKIQDELNEILKELKEYNAFNLVIGNLKTNHFYYICNPYNKKLKITTKPELLQQGQAYALTNTDIHTLWPKSEYGLKKFNQILSNYQTTTKQAEEILQNNQTERDLKLVEELKELMFDTTVFYEDPESESSILIPKFLSNNCEKYRGTVSSCYIVLDHQIKGIYKELYLVGQNYDHIVSQPIETLLKL